MNYLLEDLRHIRDLPGMWIVCEFEDVPPFFTYLPLSDLWLKPIIDNDKENEWFVGAMDLLEEKE